MPITLYLRGGGQIKTSMSLVMAKKICSWLRKEGMADQLPLASALDIVDGLRRGTVLMSEIRAVEYILPHG